MSETVEETEEGQDQAGEHPSQDGDRADPPFSDPEPGMEGGGSDPEPKADKSPKPSKPGGRTPEQKAARKAREQRERKEARERAEARARAERERLEGQASGAQVRAATASAQAEAGKVHDPAPAKGKRVKPQDQEAARLAKREEAAVLMCRAIAASTLAVLPAEYGGGDAPGDADTLGNVWGPVVAPYLVEEDGPGGIIVACVVTVQVLVIRAIRARNAIRIAAPPEGYDPAPPVVPVVPVAPEPPKATKPAGVASYDPPATLEV